MEKQIKYTEEALFNNYMVSSLGEEYVHSQMPFYFDKDTYDDMVLYSEEINRISLGILQEITDTHKKVLNYFDDFLFEDKIFKLKYPIAPMFWTRYDTFRDADKNIYFAEFNYDKPCGPKETHLALGRYSQEVYIGKLYAQEKCNEQVKIVCESNEIHIRQDLINIKEEYTYAPSDNNMNIPTLAFGNFGIYLINYKVQGFLVRWSKSFLTNDNYTWMCPLGIKEFSIRIKKLNTKNRKEIWDEIIEEVTFEYDFTSAYTNINEYI